MIVIGRYVAGSWQVFEVDTQALDHLREEIRTKQVHIMVT
jgi:hypothetical protein